LAANINIALSTFAVGSALFIVIEKRSATESGIVWGSNHDEKSALLWLLASKSL
jgi:hypothetical protein